MAKIKFNNTPEQKSLFKAIASNNRDEAYEAQYALAAFVGPVIKKVLEQAPVISNLYEELPISENEPQTLPLDSFSDIGEQDYYRVVGMTMAGGLPTNFDYGMEEVHFHSMRFESFVSCYRKYARAGRLDVLSKMITRMANETLVKQEINLVAPILYAVANAGTNGLDHVIRVGSAGQILLDDFVSLLNRASRLRTSYVGGASGTPANDTSRGVTDLVVSPETVARLRKVAYNPMNTKAGVVDGTNYSTGIPAPDQLRMQVYQTAGIPEFYGINIIEAKEFGVGYKFNTLFASFAGSKTYSTIGGSGAATFNGATSEIVIGIDRTMDALQSPVITDGDTGADLVVLPDDQFVGRSEKLGFYGRIEKGAVITDSRALTGLIV